MIDKARLYVEQDELRQVGEGEITVDSTFTVPGNGNEQTQLTILRAVAFVMSSKGGRKSRTTEPKYGAKYESKTKTQLAILEAEFDENPYGSLAGERKEALLEKLNSSGGPALSATQVSQWFSYRRRKATTEPKSATTEPKYGAKYENPFEPGKSGHKYQFTMPT